MPEDIINDILEKAEKAKTAVELVVLAGDIMEHIRSDASKFDDKDNKAAGQRVRKYSQVLIKISKILRRKISERKNQIDQSSKSKKN